jgi:hypothetical protein
LIKTFTIIGKNKKGEPNIIEANNISNIMELSREQGEGLLKTLKARFEKNMNCHKGIEWAKIQAKLEANTEKVVAQ